MKENWLLEIAAFSAGEACERAEEIARNRGYVVRSSSAEVEIHPVQSKLTKIRGLFMVRLVVIER